MMEICTLDVHGFRPKIPVHQLGQLAAEPGVFVWVDMIDTNAGEMRSIAQQFSLHPLALEDALEPAQRPKLENFDTMPETRWTFGYPMAIASMVLLTLFLTMYFKKKRYL